jgi:hypothetical protein
MTKRTIRSLTSTLVLLCAIPFAHAQTPTTVYDDALAPGWADWSFATDRDIASTWTPHSGTRVVAVNSHAWGAFGLHTDPYDVSKLTTLTFWVNGGATGGQHLMVIFNGVKNTDKGFDIPVIHPGWQQISVSLTGTGITDAKLTDIWWQNRTNADAATYYVDDVQLH